jgi:hypothetical protein
MKRSREVILPSLPYDEYIMEDYKATVLEEAEKLYNVLVDQLVCEAVNENVAKQSTEATSSSLPALPLEGDGNNQEHTEQNDILAKDKQ